MQSDMPLVGVQCRSTVSAKSSYSILIHWKHQSEQLERHQNYWPWKNGSYNAPKSVFPSFWRNGCFSTQERHSSLWVARCCGLCPRHSLFWPHLRFQLCCRTRWSKNRCASCLAAWDRIPDPLDYWRVIMWSLVEGAVALLNPIVKGHIYV